MRKNKRFPNKLAAWIVPYAMNLKKQCISTPIPPYGVVARLTKCQWG